LEKLGAYGRVQMSSNGKKRKDASQHSANGANIRPGMNLVKKNLAVIPFEKLRLRRLIPTIEIRRFWRASPELCGQASRLVKDLLREFLAARFELRS
jgi:hypothetical protein